MNSKHHQAKRAAQAALAALALASIAALALSLAICNPAHALTRKPPATTTPSRNTPAREVNTGSKSGVGLPVAIALGAIGAAGGAGATLALSRMRRPTALAAQTTQECAVSTTAPDPSTEVLVKRLIELGDRVGSDSLRTEIADALHQVGIYTQLVEQGTPFDPRRHIGVDSVPVADPQWDQRVATTEAPGYYTSERTLRLPSVTVFRFVP